MRSAIIGLWITLFTTIVVATADEIRITSELSQTHIHETDTVTLTLTVEGAQSNTIQSAIQPPDLQEDFTILSTRQSSSFSYMNGTTQLVRRYQYDLKPYETGIYIIDPFRLTYKKTTHATKPLRLVVKAGAAPTSSVPTSPSSGASSTPNPTPSPRPSTSPDRDTMASVFLETHLSNPTIFIGETVNYSVKLYRRISLWSSISVSQDSIPGVWETSIDTQPERIVNKNGQRYYEMELINKKIQPLNEGIVRIPPLAATFIVDPFSGKKQLRSNPATITVQPLPKPSPPSFMGAIGEYNMVVSSPNPAENNTVQMTVVIEGDGNMATLSAPMIQKSDQYRVLSAPSAVSTPSTNRREFDYVIIPNVSGVIQIPPIVFSYFSIDAMAYKTISSPSFSITATGPDTDDTTPVLANDIEFLADNTRVDQILGWLQAPHRMTWLWMANGMNGLIILGLFVRHRMAFRRNKQARVKRRLVHDIAQLGAHTPRSDMGALLIRVLSVYVDPVIQSMDMPLIESTLANAALHPTHTSAILNWINQFNACEFSPSPPFNNDQLTESLRDILNPLVMETTP